jgi:hypothetical protein
MTRAFLVAASVSTVLLASVGSGAPSAAAKEATSPLVLAQRGDQEGGREGRGGGGGERTYDRRDGADRGGAPDRGARERSRDTSADREAAPRERDGKDGRRSDGDYRRGERRSRDYIRRHGRHQTWGPGISFYFYDGYYYGDCGWLRRRARVTGSPYWWRRYRQCRDWW